MVPATCFFEEKKREVERYRGAKKGRVTTMQKISARLTKSRIARRVRNTGD